MIELLNICAGYGNKLVIHQINGCFRSGTMTAITGPNGAGKSTLLKAIMGLVPLKNGCIRIEEGKSISYLPQISNIDRRLPVNVKDIVLSGLLSSSGLLKGMNSGDMLKMRDSLSRVGLSGFESYSLAELSGGQFQRVMLARCLIQNGDVILIDEPFNAVDAQTARDISNILTSLVKEESKTVIAVLHSEDLIREYFDQCLLLSHKVISWGETEYVLCEQHKVMARQLIELS